MDTIRYLRVILTSFLLVAMLRGFCQPTAAVFLIRPSLAEDSLSPLSSIRELIFIERAARMAGQDLFNPEAGFERPELYFFTGPGLSYTQRHRYYVSIAANPGQDIMYSYKKIDLSSSGNLDYKKFAEKLPKPTPVSDLGLLLYGIFNKSYFNAPPNPNPPGK